MTDDHNRNNKDDKNDGFLQAAKATLKLYLYIYIIIQTTNKLI